MRHWWVNQNQTYKHEVEGGYLWSPKAKTDGNRNYFYDTMKQTAPGDVVFSFSDTYIKAIGIVSGLAESAPKPTAFGSAGEHWGDEGWFVPVEYVVLDDPIRPKDHMDVLQPTLPPKYAPLQPNGNGNQGVYLTEVHHPLARELRQLLRGQVEAIESTHTVEPVLSADQEQKRIDRDPSVSDPERQQLVRARVGQGLFRSRVELIEPACRLTGVSDRRFLRASHIKPWACSSNTEKLDGYNGLMLSPHVDHLFDKGFISFMANGELLVSARLPPAVMAAWQLKQPAESPPFAREQSVYLEYHRTHVFVS